MPPTPEPTRSWRPSLRLVIGLVLGGMVTLTAGAIIWTSHWRSRSAVLEVSEELVGRVAQTTRDQVWAFLLPPKGAVELLREEGESGTLDPADGDALQAHFCDLLRVNPSIAMLNYGSEQGDFMMVQRQPDGALWTKRVERTGQEAVQVSWERRVAGVPCGGSAAIELDPEDHYDPRVRPWYQGAKQAGGLFWSDVYVFWSGGSPGMTLAVPHEPRGELSGVFGVDISLGQLSTYLAGLEVTEHGLAIALDRRGMLVGAGAAGEAGKLQLAAESPDPAIAGLAGTAELRSWLDGGAVPAGSVPFQLGEQRWLASVVPIGLDPERDWVVCIAAPEDDFTAGLRQASVRNLEVGAVLTLAALLVSLLIAGWIGRVLQRLATESGRIRDLRFEGGSASSPPFREVADVVDAFERMKVGLRAFQLYLPLKLVRQLLEQQREPRLGGETREVTIYFSDIAGFTPISEQLGPMQMAERLGEYLAAVSGCIQEHEGTVVQYVGDEVFAFWGAPLEVKRHVLRGAEAALAVQERLDSLWEFDEDHPRMPTRIGVHTAEVAIGHFGSADRMYYGAIGDGVVLTSRLEGINKLYGTRIILSEPAAVRVLEHFELRRLDRVAVKGRAQPVTIYELLGRRGELPGERLEFIRRYEAALDRYLRGEWSEAVEAFDELRSEDGEDGPTRALLARCMAFAAEPPQGWEGHYQVTVK